MSHRPASRTHGPGQALRLSALPGPVACAARAPEMIGGEAAFSLFLPVRQRAPGGSHGVLGLLVVLRPSFGRGPAARPMHQPTGVVPVHPGAGDLLLVRQGPHRDGPEGRAATDALGLVWPDGRFRQGVIQGNPRSCRPTASARSGRTGPRCARPRRSGGSRHHPQGAPAGAARPQPAGSPLHELFQPGTTS